MRNLSDDRHFGFKPIERGDFPLMSRWLSTPHVWRWWNDDPSLLALEEDYGGCIDGTEPAEVFLAVLNDQPVGLIQRFKLQEYPEYMAELACFSEIPPDAYSLDYFIGPEEQLGKGLGSAMLQAFVAKLWDELPAACTVIVPTRTDNRASWRSLERTGFRRVADCELTPDNPGDDKRHYIYRLDRPAS